MSSVPDRAHLPGAAVRQHIAVEIGDQRLPMRMHVGHAQARMLAGSRRDGRRLGGGARQVVVASIYVPLMIVATLRNRARQRSA